MFQGLMPQATAVEGCENGAVASLAASAPHQRARTGAAGLV